ncbi:Alpha-amylase [Phytophthora palmivora]|uniref:Alpha-amylase n=1 Tax=Phytophthora palmivora TaxID=4796 RepID=A0A2P4XF85_9STRA|nr:Alpha-amylase [Phytophthora palmivora]
MSHWSVKEDHLMDRSRSSLSLRKMGIRWCRQQRNSNIYYIGRSVIEFSQTIDLKKHVRGKLQRRSMKLFGTRYVMEHPVCELVELVVKSKTTRTRSQPAQSQFDLYKTMILSGHPTNSPGSAPMQQLLIINFDRRS